MASTNGMVFDDLSDAPNGPALADRIGNQVDLFYGRSVANTAAMTALTGAFKGQQVFIEDIDTFGVWDGAAWRRPVQSGNAAVTGAVTTPRLQAVVFPLAYPTGVIPTIVLSVQTNASQSPSALSVAVDLVTPPTETGFTIRAVNTANTNAMSVNWIARG